MMLSDQVFALRTRDAIERLVLKKIDEARPRARFATVVEITASSYRCKVEFQPGTEPAVARIGSIQPTRVGQVVRVSGPPDDLWVIDVIGGGTLSGELSDFIEAPTGFQLFNVGPGFVASWNGVPYVEKYELQVADDSGFTVNNRSFTTLATQFTLQDLNTGDTYYARVRAVSGGSSVGPWSSVLSTTVTGYPVDGSSDGTPPASSPTPVCQAGLGMITAEWVPVPNNDLVTYEVHVSLESGFTPGPSTLLMETTGNFWAFRRLADDTPLPYTSPTFVRIVAKDADGSAPAGPQGFATPDQLSSDDFGAVENLSISDGVAPTTSPVSIQVTAGIGYLWLTWAPVANGDLVTYEVHMSTNSGFTPTANTLALETQSAFALVRKLPPGFGSGAIGYETTYYIKVWARDRDGYAPAPSPAQAATTAKTRSTDLANGAVGTLQLADAAIVSAKIADLAVGAAKIQDAAINTAHIINGAITNAKIGNLAVQAANIADLAVGTAKIANGAITDAKIANLTADKIVAGTLSSVTITGNTITGNTITGNTINGGTITGANIRSASSGARVEVQSGNNSGYVFYFSGHPTEVFPGYVYSGYGTDPYGRAAGFITVAGPKVAGNSGALLEMWNIVSDGSAAARVNGDLEIMNGYLVGNSSSLIIGLGGFAEPLIRHVCAQTYTEIFYSRYANVSFKLAEDGNAVVWQSGVPVWNAGVSISDERLKENIQRADVDSLLVGFRQLPIVTFEFRKGNEVLPSGRRLGVLAQDVEKFYPQGVQEIGGFKLLDNTSMTSLLLALARNLDERVSALEGAL